MGGRRIINEGNDVALKDGGSIEGIEAWMDLGERG